MLVLEAVVQVEAVDVDGHLILGAGCHIRPMSLTLMPNPASGLPLARRPPETGVVSFVMEASAGYTHLSDSAQSECNLCHRTTIF